MRAWRHRGVPYLPTYHIVTARDTWCGREGAWLTAVQLCRRLEGLVERATIEAPQQLAHCRMALAEVGVRLEAAEADPRVHTLPPSLYRAATGMGSCWPRREPEAGVAGCEASKARWEPGPGSGCWKLACKRSLSDAVETGEEVGHKGADAARCKVTKFFVEKWAPAMAYPRAGAAMHINTTHRADIALANSWEPPNQMSNYQAARNAAGKQVMSVEGARCDAEAGRPLATRISLQEAEEMHRAARVRTGAPSPGALTQKGTAHLFKCPGSALPSPYVIDNATALDPLRRPFCRSRALEDP